MPSYRRRAFGDDWLSDRGIPPDFAENLCHIAPERVDRPGQKIWFVNAPYGGSLLRFRGEPSSLLYAIAPTVDEIQSGGIPGVTCDDLALLNPLNRSEAFYIELEMRLAVQKSLRAVCVSTMTAACPEARRIAGIVKKVAQEQNRDIVTIFGGPHEDDVATCTAVDPRYSELADFSISGDGEYLLLELIRTVFELPGERPATVKEEVLRRMDRITGCLGRGSLWFRLAGGDHQLRPACGSLRLDELPRMPRWLLNESDTRNFSVFKEGGWNVKTAQIMTQRGCQWRCNFCSESGSANTRSVDSVMAEIEEVRHFEAQYSQLGRHDYKAVFFDDSTFTSRAPRRVRFLDELFARLQASGIEWGCQTRLDQIDTGILKQMRAAGCTYLYTGLESASNEMLRAMVKDETRDAAERAFAALRQSGIRVGVSLMFGAVRTGAVSTTESKATVESTLAFVEREARDGNFVVVSPNLATFYPGTTMTATSGLQLDFHNPLANQGYPWNRFEEGEGFHPEGLTRELAKTILDGCVSRFSEYAVEQDLYSIEEYQHAYRHELVPSLGCVDLNHASIASPLEGARSAAIAIAQVAARLDAVSHETCCERTRRVAALLLGANDSQQVVLTRNATEAAALAVALSGLPAGAHVVTTDVENLSIPRVFRRFMDHGNTGGYDLFSSFQDYGSRGLRHPLREPRPAEMTVEVANVLDRLDCMEKTILSLVNDDTAMVVFSHVVRDTGRICNVAKLCCEIRQRNPRTLILVDGAQALGTVPTIALGEFEPDFYIAAPHKTLGTYPIGLLYVRKPEAMQLDALQARDDGGAPISVVLQGMFAPALRVRPTYDMRLSVPEVASFRGAIDSLHHRALMDGLSFEPLCLHRRVIKDTATEMLWNMAQAGHVLLHSLGPRHSSFIFSFQFAGTDNRAVVEHLWKHRIFASYIARGDRIRFSFGADTTQEDAKLALQRALDAYQIYSVAEPAWAVNKCITKTTI